MIIRRGPSAGWTPIPHVTARDSALSWRARGLLVELLSYPTNYEITVDELVRRCRRCGGKCEGRDAMRAAANELKKAGYLIMTRWQDGLGHWKTGVELSDRSILDRALVGTTDELECAGTTDDGIPGVGEPAIGEPGVIKKKEEEDQSSSADDEQVSIALVSALLWPPALRPSPAQITQLSDLAAAALASGWTRADLVARLVATFGPKVRSPFAVVKKTLTSLPVPPRTFCLPNWCAHPTCDREKRLRHDLETDEVRRCPECHPGGLAEGGPS